ncbi:MAG TPA: hypothetical protein VFJ05_06095 [Nitrososphaeraceae archaeon]|nr:hypothetical protein [Nitrososphaeraceae archaeon]
MLDYFEMDRVIEELAKAYPAQCATTWFKITKNHKPTKEEYRDKVVEYMKQFEYLLATYPQGLETDKLKELVKKSLGNEIEKVLQGNNNDVERRYKHYVENSPSESKNILEKEVTEKCPDRDAALIEKSQENEEDNTGQEREQQEIQYEKSLEERRRKKKKMMISG